MYTAVSVSRKHWRPATYRNWFWHGTSVFRNESWRKRKRCDGRRTINMSEGMNGKRDTDRPFETAVLTRTWGYQISYRSNLVRGSWESRRSCYSPQFPRTIASSCCCWPIGFSRVTSRTYTHTRTYIHTHQPTSIVSSITVSKFLTRVPVHPIFNVNRLVTFYDASSPNLPAPTSIHGAADQDRQLAAGDSQLCPELRQ